MLQLAVVLLAQTPQQELARAVKLHQAGDLEGATRAYEAVLQAQPENVVARSNLGAVYSRQGRYQDAIEQYMQALALDRQNPGIRFNLALAYYDSAQIPKAAVEFDQVMATQPDNDRAALLLADCDLRMGENRKVIELLGPREAAHPDDRAMIYVLGTALIRDNQTERGQKLIDRILRNGESAEAHVMLGTASMMGQDYKNAAKEFARAIELDPRLPLAHRLYGRVLLVQSNVPQSIEGFRGELAVDPNDYDSHLMLAVLLKQEKEYDEALQHLNRALEIRPGAPDARYQLGSLYLATGDLAKAQRILEKLLQESPDFVEAHVSLATVYYRLKRKADGDREQEMVRQLNAQTQARPEAAAGTTPIDPSKPKETFEALSERAEAARQADKTDEAIELYLRALDLRLDWPEGWWYVGTLYYQSNRYAKARPAFEKLTALKPKGGPAWAMLGLCEFELQNYEGALDNLQHARVLGLESDSHLSVVSRYHLALLLNRLGDSPSAVQLLWPLARLESDLEAVIQALGISALELHVLPKDLSSDKRSVVTDVGWAEYYLARRNVEEAGVRFGQVLAAYPSEPGIHYVQGVFLLASDASKALGEFKKELGISPQHLNARLQIAFEYIKRNDYATGLPYAEQAVKLAPQSFAARNALGRILLELGETGRAIRELETGVKLEPESTETLYALARAYSRAGRKQDADRARAEFNRLDKLRRGLNDGGVPMPEGDRKKAPPG